MTNIHNHSSFKHITDLGRGSRITPLYSNTLWLSGFREFGLHWSGSATVAGFININIDSQVPAAGI